MCLVHSAQPVTALTLRGHRWSGGYAEKMCTFYVAHSTFCSLQDQEGLSGRSYGPPAFPLHHQASFSGAQAGWLVQEDAFSKKWQERVSCLFIVRTLSACCTQRNSWFNRKHGIPGLHVALTLSYVPDVLACILLKPSSFMATRVL